MTDVDAVEVMTENPYRLARDIRGIGFKMADAIAMKLGMAKTAMIRVRAGIGYALTEAMDEGHCGLPREELGPLAAKLLEVPDDAIRSALELELAEGTVVADTVADTPCGFLGHLYRAERAIAERLLRIAAGRLPWPGIDVERALPWVARETGLSLAPGQVLADIIASGAVPVVRLTEVFRQAARSRIMTSAHGINRGAIPDLSRPDGDSDFYFVPVEDPETAAARIVDLVKARIPRRFGLDAVRDIRSCVR